MTSTHFIASLIFALIGLAFLIAVLWSFAIVVGGPWLAKHKKFAASGSSGLVAGCSSRVPNARNVFIPSKPKYHESRRNCLRVIERGMR